MEKAPAYTITRESVTVIWDGKPYTVHKDAVNFQGLRKALYEHDWESVPKHLTVAGSVKKWSNDKFTLDGDKVSYLGEPLPTDLTSRIIAMATNNEDPTIIFNFWERLQKNPSFRSVQQLWGFLKHEGIPLTSDGCFLAYKGVNENYTDKYTGKIDNSPGAVNEMPRNQISDDPKVACHFGYHVGALSYAQSFGAVVVVCKVDPENVVCIPYDSSQQKMRVSKYEVIGNHGTQLPSTSFIEDKYDDEDDDYPVDDDEDNEEEGSCTGQPDCAGCQDDLDDLDNLDSDLEEDEDKDLPPDEEDEEDEEPVVRAAPASKPKRGFIKLTKMDMGDLMKQSIEELRRYATHGLDIVGASKIPGGKLALVNKILKVRK